MNDPQDALMAALAEVADMDHGYRAAAEEILSLLECRGWKLVQADPFVSTNEALAAVLDTFQEAAGQYALDRAGGSSREERESHQAMINARTALVRLVIGERAGSTNAPAIGAADADPVIHREMRIDDLDERLTKIEDWLDGLWGRTNWRRT